MLALNLGETTANCTLAPFEPFEPFYCILDLDARDQVSVRYRNVEIDDDIGVGKHDFEVRSNGGTVGNATVFVVSEAGSGKVGVDRFDNGGTENTRIADDIRAGSEVALDFFFNLEDDEFVYKGEVEITIPSDWTPPRTDVDTGKVTAKIIRVDNGTEADVDEDGNVDDDDKPTVSISGRTAVVSIPRQSSEYSLQITYAKATAPPLLSAPQAMVLGQWSLTKALFAPQVKST